VQHPKPNAGKIVLAGRGAVELRIRVKKSYEKILSQAEEENGQSRIYLGIHWAFDKTQGIALGRRVADYVFDHAFTLGHP